jgi:hypothetical protein
VLLWTCKNGIYMLKDDHHYEKMYSIEIRWIVCRHIYLIHRSGEFWLKYLSKIMQPQWFKIVLTPPPPPPPPMVMRHGSYDGIRGALVRPSNTFKNSHKADQYHCKQRRIFLPRHNTPVSVQWPEPIYLHSLTRQVLLSAVHPPSWELPHDTADCYDSSSIKLWQQTWQHPSS